MPVIVPLPTSTAVDVSSTLGTLAYDYLPEYVKASDDGLLGSLLAALGAPVAYATAVLTDPDQYDGFLAALDGGRVDADLRRQLALAAFRHTADYDAAIASWLAGRIEAGDALAAGEAAAEAVGTGAVAPL